MHDSEHCGGILRRFFDTLADLDVDPAGSFILFFKGFLEEHALKAVIFPPPETSVRGLLVPRREDVALLIPLCGKSGSFVEFRALLL